MEAHRRNVVRIKNNSYATKAELLPQAPLCWPAFEADALCAWGSWFFKVREFGQGQPENV
jgi:hypothetical protein